MGGRKKRKGGQETAQNNSKKQSRVQIKPREEGVKKGLKEYENDVTETIHSQGGDRLLLYRVWVWLKDCVRALVQWFNVLRTELASFFTTQRNSPCLQQKRASSCEGRPPLEEGDFKAQGKEPEKEMNHFKGEHMALVEKGPASSSTQHSTASLQKEMVYSSEGQPPKADEDDVAKLEAILEVEKAKGDEVKGHRSACLQCGTWEWNPKFDTQNSIQKLEILPRLNDEDDGAQCKEENATLKEENAILKEENAILKEAKAILKEEMAKLRKRVKCREGFVTPHEVMLRELLSEFHQSDRGKAINKDLWKWAKQKYPKFHNMQQIKFSTAIAVLVKEGNEDTENKLKDLQLFAELWEPPQTFIPGLVWDKETGKGYFFCCKALASLNIKLHPNVKGDEANDQIEEMANTGFIFEGVDIGKFATGLRNL